MRVQDLGTWGRVGTPLQALGALVALSPLVVFACPPVGRPTRVHLLLALAHALALAHLLLAAYLAAVTRALCALRRAAWAARRDAAWRAGELAAQRHAGGADARAPWAGPDAAALELASGAEDGAGPGRMRDAGLGGREVAGGMLSGLRVAGWGHGQLRDATRDGKAAKGRCDADGPPHEAPRKGDVCKGDADGEEALDWAGWAGPGWGGADGAAVRMLCGLATVRPRSAGAWGRHVEAVDGAVRVCGPGLAAMAAVAILGGVGDVLLPPMPGARPPAAL